LEKAIAANPTVAKWRIALARCLVAEKRLDEARVLSDELLKRFASEPAWKYERLMLMITMNDPISACWEEFNQLRGLDTAPARLPIDMLAYARAHARDWSPLVPAAMQVAGK